MCYERYLEYALFKYGRRKCIYFAKIIMCFFEFHSSFCLVKSHVSKLVMLKGLLYYQMDHANELSNSLKESANINTVRASLIVEECTRLGLMVR